jgi:hypothetical protein
MCKLKKRKIQEEESCLKIYLDSHFSSKFVDKDLLGLQLS